MVGVVSITVVEGGMEMEETLVVVGIVVVDVVSGVEVEVSVTMTVVVGDVVKLVEVVVRVVTMTESVDELKLAVSVVDMAAVALFSRVEDQSRPAAASGRTGLESIQQG